MTIKQMVFTPAQIGRASRHVVLPCAGVEFNHKWRIPAAYRIRSRQMRVRIRLGVSALLTLGVAS
jgi:hypothetical protein